MANLGADIPNETNSAQRFVQSADRGPSFLENLADFGTSLVGVANKAVTSLEQGSANKRAAADEAAKNDAVKRINTGVFQDPSVKPNPNIPPASTNAYNNSKPLAQQAANTQAAANQGKVDLGMAQAKSLAVFRQALAANPGHEFAVFQAFKEAGVDNMMMQQYKNAESNFEADEASQRTIMDGLKKDAVTKYGYSDFFQRPADEQSKILATVGNLNAQEADLDTKTKLAGLTLQNQQLTIAQRNDLQKTTSSGLFDSANTYLTSSFSNVSKLMINQLGDPTLANQPGRLEQLQSHFMNVALPALDLQYQTKKATLGSLLTPEDATRLDETYKSQRQALVDMISGPQSVVESNKRVLENISTTAGIEYAKAAPTLMRLQKMVGPQAIGVLLSPAINGNKPLMDLLTGELKGVIQDPSKMPSFTELLQSLNGTIDPNSWDPEKQRAAAPAKLSVMSNLARNDPATNGTDKQGHQVLVNSIKDTASIAVDVVPQWGFSNVLTQGKALNTRGVTTSLFNVSANASDRIDAIHAWLPATTRTYMTLAGMNSGDQFYNATLDPHTLKWSAVWNGKQDMRPMPGVGVEVSVNSHPSPSTKVLEQVSTLNHMLNNLSDAGSKGYDDSIKGASYNEARRYFATGEQPASLQKPAATKNGKTPEQNVDDAISHMLDFVNKMPAPTTPVAHGEIGASPLAGAIGTSAEKYNVPPNIAAALFHTETSGGRNIKTSDKGAVGPGQIMPATAAGYGKDVSKLSNEENVDLALHILSDNYKRTGSWEDALAMYHSGHDLKTATARGLNDGHMRTSDYVSTTMATASSITPDNLKRYGYVRY